MELLKDGINIIPASQVQKMGGVREILEGTKSIHDYTINGKCSGCGSCCSNRLHFTRNEIITIRNYIHRNNIPEQKHTCALMVGDVIDMVCPFFDTGSHICTIYPVRPIICQKFICSKEGQQEAVMGVLEDLGIEEILTGSYESYDVRSLFYGDKKDYLPPVPRKIHWKQERTRHHKKKRK